MKTEFNMAAAIREQLEANPKLSLREAREAVQAAYPKQTLNTNSFGVAFSNQRRKLGIKPGGGKRRVVQRTVPQAPKTPLPAARGTLPLASLETAKRLIVEAGGADNARALLSFLQ